MQGKHKDIGGYVVKLHWEGNGMQCALVTSLNRGYWVPSWRHDRVQYKRNGNSKTEYHYILWGAAGKELNHLAAVECVTRSGKGQSEKTSLKTFYEMIETSKHVTIK
jgi:hypothetical protein